MEFERGQYELVFHAGAYFARQAESKPHNNDTATCSFMTRWSYVLALRMPQNYHVPLLISPFGYTTYRGS
jgi:5-hydroxyisourate hydrolase